MLTVYVDVLILVNIIVDYFLIRASTLISRITVNNGRIVIASLIGGMFSLYIFAPNYGFIINFLVLLVTSFVISIFLIGKRKVITYLKFTISYLLINYLFGGIMSFICQNIKTDNVMIYNNIVYFGVSPILILIISSIFYIIFTIIEKVFAIRFPKSSECTVFVKINDFYLSGNGIIDTGNNLREPFSEKPVIICSDKSFMEYMKLCDKKKYRAIPYNDISNKGILNALICDEAQIVYDSNEFKIYNPIIASCPENISDNEHKFILSYELISNNF